MRLSAHTLALGAALGAAACDTTPRARDAAAAGPPVAEVAVRIEVAGDGAPSVSVLAYRASAAGVAPEDVLSVVDPLNAPAPGPYCTMRDVAGAARALGASGGKVELEALAGLQLDFGEGFASITPARRVYPSVASVVGGVVAEAGPVTLEGAPVRFTLVDAAGNRADALLPTQPRLGGPDGEPLAANSVLAVTGEDLVLGVTGGPHPSFLELRPFGATWALACPITGRDRVVVRAADVARLAQLHVPVSIEAVAREAHPINVGGTSVRLTLEARSSSVVELRP